MSELVALGVRPQLSKLIAKPISKLAHCQYLATKGCSTLAIGTDSVERIPGRRGSSIPGEGLAELDVVGINCLTIQERRSIAGIAQGVGDVAL